MTYSPDQTSFQHSVTSPRQERFLESLSLFGNVRLACRAVSISPDTAYHWRQASAEFALVWDRVVAAARARDTVGDMGGDTSENMPDDMPVADLPEALACAGDHREDAGEYGQFEGNHGTRTEDHGERAGNHRESSGDYREDAGDRLTHFTDTTATSALGHHTVLTPLAQADFLESLAASGNVRLACRAAGVSPQTLYRARRRSGGFALAWDAACLSARSHAEEALADRAINGWEEAVFYHGEEVARRRRFSDRLLLAHLARLDALAERLGAAGAGAGGLAYLDDRIDALRRGEEPAEPYIHPAGSPAAGQENPLDRVPPVPSCRECGGRCDDPRADMLGLLGPQDCQWLGNRINRMDAARPKDADQPSDLARTYDETSEIEALQLEAFEAGGHQWWLVTDEAQLIASCAHEDGASADGASSDGASSDGAGNARP